MKFHFNLKYRWKRRSHFSRGWSMLQSRLTAVLAVVLGLSTTAHAHSLSTSYGQLATKTAQTTGPVLQLQVALSDLQLTLGWSTQRDLTWTMVKNQHPQILAYVQQQLVLHDSKHQPLACSWQSAEADWQLKQIQQQYYLQLSLKSDCPSAAWLHYRLFTQIHEHKALLQTPNGEQVLAEATPWLAL
jgi:hypothetical protein